MKYNSLIPELTVCSIEKSKKFYIDLLNFKLIYERIEDKFCMIGLDDVQFMLEEVNGNWEVGPLTYPFGKGINFEITVKKVIPIYNNLILNNIKLFRDLKINEYRKDDKILRVKEFLVQDEDGYLLRFAQDL